MKSSLQLQLISPTRGYFWCQSSQKEVDSRCFRNAAHQVIWLNIPFCLNRSKSINVYKQIKIPSRKLIYPACGKGKSFCKVPLHGDMLVPWRVNIYIYKYWYVKICYVYLNWLAEFRSGRIWGTCTQPPVNPQYCSPHHQSLKRNSILM